jgi:hypothetical protein
MLQTGEHHTVSINDFLYLCLYRVHTQVISYRISEARCVTRYYQLGTHIHHIDDYTVMLQTGEHHTVSINDFLYLGAQYYEPVYVVGVTRYYQLGTHIHHIDGLVILGSQIQKIIYGHRMELIGAQVPLMSEVSPVSLVIILLCCKRGNIIRCP